MKRKPYPDIGDFPIETTGYGFNNLCGIGVYTYDPVTWKTLFAWPDPQCIVKSEYDHWCKTIRAQGYRVPKIYLGQYWKPPRKIRT